MQFRTLFILIWLVYSPWLVAQQSGNDPHDEHASHAMQAELNTTLPPEPEALHQQTTATRYVCPMHSHIVRDEPGTCPICGMDLEPRNMVQSHSEHPSVSVSGAMQQAMNLVSEPVARGTLWKYIETLGVVTFDEADISHVHPRVSGWIEKLHVATEGQTVKQGELLYTLYSPDLVVAQDDYLQVLRSKLDKNSPLFQQARRRLTLLGMSVAVIESLEKRGKSTYSVPFYADRDGVVTKLNVRDGMYVKPDMEIVAIADLTHLWVIADVFESQFDWLKIGKPAEIHLDPIGVHHAEASIDYIYPQLDAVTRSLKVRLTLQNPLGRVKPGMNAKVVIYGGPKRDVLHIPAQALLSTEHVNRVVVKTDHETFEIRQVETGMQTRGRVEILSGLAEGEQIVTSGQFLIDSEASLTGSLPRVAGAHQH